MSVTLEQTVAEVTEIVAEQPNKRAECQYTNIAYDDYGDEINVPTRPECIAGVWLFAKRHVPISSLVQIEGQHIGEGIKVLADEVDMDPVAVIFLRTVQYGQDNGLTWQQALDTANYLRVNDSLPENSIWAVHDTFRSLSTGI